MSIDRRLIATGILVSIVSVVAAALAVAALRRFRPAPEIVQPTLRLALLSPDDSSVGGLDYPFGLALAPDGRRLAFPAARAGTVQLWLRDLTTNDIQALPGTEQAVLPFWAPDGRALGFFAEGRLRILTFDGAVVRDLAEAASPRGGVWHPSGDIIFAPQADDGLYRRRADGTIEPFTTIDRGGGETSHRLPMLIGDGRRLLFFVASGSTARQGLWIARADAPVERKRLVGTAAHGLAIDDVVIYASDGALLAQPLDRDTLSLTGRPILLGSPVGHGPHHQLFATAGDGHLIYGAPAPSVRELRWVDRQGDPVGVLGEPMEAWDVRLSPGGATVAVTRADPQLGTLDIWAYDGRRPLPRRLSPAIDVDEAPAWARDGSRLAWVTGRRSVTVRGAQAALAEETLRKFQHPVRVTDWSPDGQWIIVSESRPVTHQDILLVPAVSGDPVPYATSAFNEVHATVSPDGRWMAYASDESGRFEIYIDSFPAPGRRARLTTGGGVDPRWRRDGRELFFRRGAEVHAVVPFAGDGLPQAMSTERLFDAGVELRAYDAAGDGNRFLLNVPAGGATPPPVTVLVNARSLLRFAP